MEPFVFDEKTSLLRLKAWENAVPGLAAGFTTRIGGVSLAPYQSLNCGLHVQDDAEHVIHNRKQLCQWLNFPFEYWTCAEQVHGHHVTVVVPSMKGSGSTSLDSAIPQTDGLVTDQRDILLTSFYADCVPLFFLVPEKGIMGIAHAGWKGTAANIAGKVVDLLYNHFHVEPGELQVAIGPSIGACCYEVDDRVIGALSAHFPQEIAGHMFRRKENGKFDLDLKQVNHNLLLQAGLSSPQILTSQWCTGCRTDLFFSHRMEGGRTGRMAAYLGLHSEE